LTLVLRHVPNDFAMPFFSAFLFDPERPQSRFFNGGWGCDFDKHAALMRAVTEAAQSRVAFLHGGRDAPEDDANVAAQIEAVSRAAPQVAFAGIAASAPAQTLEGRWAQACACLRRVVDRPVYRVILTPQEGPLHVVRLVVPMLEHFAKDTMRVGPRLQAELEKDAAA
jgi:ribosomal protein S12 methylthiotransferase accessory factor